MDEHPDCDRRGFLAFSTLALGALPFGAVLLAALRTGFAPAATDAPDRISLCRLDEVPTNGGILERVVSYRVRRGPRVENGTDEMPDFDHVDARERAAVWAFALRMWGDRPTDR